MSIDLYAIYGLDRQQPPEALAQQLDRQLAATDPSDSLTRGRIETARVILGDSSRRAVYDQQLGDPSASPVTEATLAALAGRPVPAATPITLTSLLATTRGKVVAGGAAALVLILLLVIAVAAVSGGDESGGESVTASSSSSSSSGGSSSASGEVRPNSKISSTSWDKRDNRPTSALVLTKATQLPAQFDPELSQNDPPCRSEGYLGTGSGLVQYQDRNVGYVYAVSPEGSTSTREVSIEIAVLNPAGDLVSTNTYTYENLGTGPQTFDLMKSKSSGYARVEAENGVSIPALAAGDKDGKHYATCILPDAFDDELLWVTMRGSSSVYQAQIREVGA